MTASNHSILTNTENATFLPNTEVSIVIYQITSHLKFHEQLKIAICSNKLFLVFFYLFPPRKNHHIHYKELQTSNREKFLDNKTLYFGACLGHVKAGLIF